MRSAYGVVVRKAEPRAAFAGMTERDGEQTRRVGALLRFLAPRDIGASAASCYRWRGVAAVSFTLM